MEYYLALRRNEIQDTLPINMGHSENKVLMEGVSHRPHTAQFHLYEASRQANAGRRWTGGGQVLGAVGSE